MEDRLYKLFPDVFLSFYFILFFTFSLSTLLKIRNATYIIALIIVLLSIYIIVIFTKLLQKRYFLYNFILSWLLNALDLITTLPIFNNNILIEANLYFRFIYNFMHPTVAIIIIFNFKLTVFTIVVYLLQKFDNASIPERTYKNDDLTHAMEFVYKSRYRVFFSIFTKTSVKLEDMFAEMLNAYYYVFYKFSKYIIIFSLYIPINNIVQILNIPIIIKNIVFYFFYVLVIFLVIFQIFSRNKYFRKYMTIQKDKYL